MADPADPAASYQSLYRRYRPQRFDEVLGQEHITRALRNAVREGRVGHAYLFSGPRGTGKTSTARILAKVLNCANPVDGEPDGVCDNCVAVERGQVVDWLLEQDAASKSKVDDMRDLLERVPLGTSGNRKVIILDEVHMLSQGAENALLKTLEEPPDHVVFVLATTDPQKVRATIRSRTQHFAFHLLPREVLADHVGRVIDDAGLSLADREAAVTHVVQAGGGSARDTLSALDQVAALGEVMSDSQPVDAILDALADRDAGAALAAVAEATATGRDPRALGEAVIVRLRDAFLALMGVPEAQDDRACALGDRLGAAGITRALDVLGEALTELSRKPDPRIVLEVALVRLVRPEADRDVAAILDRLDRLERAVQAGGVAPAAVGQAPPGGGAAGGGSAGGDAAGGSGGGMSSGGVPAGSAPPVDVSGPGAPPAAGGAEGPGAAGAAGGAGAAGSGGPGGPGGPGGRPADGARAALAARRGKTAGGRAPTPQPGGVPATGPAPGQAGASGQPGAEAGAPSASAPGSAPTASSGEVDHAGPGGSGGQASSATASAGGAPAEPPGRPNAEGSATASSGSAAPAPVATAGAPAGTGPGPAAPAPVATAGAPVGAGPGTAAPAAGGAGDGVGQLPDLGTLTQAWSGQVLGALPIPVRSKWRGGKWLDVAGGSVRFAVPNEWHKKACDGGRLDVERALTAHFGHQVPVEVVVDGGQPAAAPPTAGPGRGSGPAPSNGPPSVEEPEDVISPDEIHQLEDADDATVGGVDLLLREFGGELVEEDP